MKNNSIFGLLLMTVFFFSSCDKNDDLPGETTTNQEQVSQSLSQDALFTNWDIKEVNHGVTDYSSEFSDLSIMFSESGDLWLMRNLEAVSRGSWELNEKSQVLSLKLESTGPGVHTIDRLSGDWKVDSFINGQVEFHNENDMFKRMIIAVSL